MIMKPVAAILSFGKRLHLQHGPIDLIIGADKNRQAAFEAAKYRFDSVLEELVEELPFLRAKLLPDTSIPKGEIANKMHSAALPFCGDQYVTRMAAVAGAVADTVLDAMKVEATFDKAYVNNGGDVSLYVNGDEEFTSAMSDHQGVDLGRISIKPEDKIRGIATSGRHGRSHSLGIADSVTVLAETAAKADVAATLIANAVNLEDHSTITRVAANSLDPDSDLGEHLVVTDCKRMNAKDQEEAITLGETKAQHFLDLGLINGAAIFFQDEIRIVGSKHLNLKERMLNYA